MIDDLRKTDLLMARLKEALPIEANITPHLAGVLAEKSPEITIPGKCKILDVVYSGDMGGILCCLDIGGHNTKTPYVASITHLAFDRRMPLSRDIETYQRHRTKKLKQQQDRGY
jgi:hypothetical protein